MQRIIKFPIWYSRCIYLDDQKKTISVFSRSKRRLNAKRAIFSSGRSSVMWPIEKQKRRNDM